MLTNQFNTYLYAIGSGMLHSIWMAALLLLTYYAVTRLWQLKANAKYTMAVLANGIVLLAFFTAIFTSTTSQQETSFLSFPAISWVQSSLDFVRTQLMPVMAAAYCIVCAGMLLRLALGWHSITHIRQQNLLKPAVDIRLFVRETAQWMHIKKPVAVWLSHRISSPMTVGFLKPVILLPVAIVNQLTPAQVEAILIHELAHIKRFDYLINIGLQIANSLLFFNPFARQLLKIAYAEREYSCDDWVLQFNYDKQLYAQALLNIGRATVQPAIAMGLANKKHGSLYQRICRLAGVQPVTNIDYSQYIGRGISLLLVMALIGVASVDSKQRMPNTGMTVTKNKETPIELQYARMAFDWMFGSKAVTVKTTATKPLSNAVAITDEAAFVANPEAPHAPDVPSAIPLLAVANNNQSALLADLLPDLPANVAEANRQVAELEALSAELAHREALLQHQIAKEEVQQQLQAAQAAADELAQLDKWKQWLKTVLLENKTSIEALEKAKLLERELSSPNLKQQNGYTVFESPELTVTLNADEDLVIAPKKTLTKPTAPKLQMESLPSKPTKAKRIISL